MPEQEGAPIAPRRLVVCCDGTWNSADGSQVATNVLRMARIVQPTAQQSGAAQIVYYDNGVGTGNWLDRLAGGGTGIGLSHNVRDAYAFLVNNHAPGDEIFLFGFSRGAYTARCVAALIGAIGLMSDRDMGSFDEVWDWYRLPEKQRKVADLDRRFPARLRDVRIKCLGVWDTVGSLGIPPNRWLRGWKPCEETYRFHNVILGTHVDHAFQALAIDEQRLAFQPAIWTRDPEAPPEQEIRQVWFPGVHSDIGGGYTQHGASDLALLWMVSRVAPLLNLDLQGLSQELDCSEPHGAGTLHDTFTGAWRYLGRFQRKHGGGANEFIHASVRTRMDSVGYRPAGKFGDPGLPIEPISDLERKFAWQVARFQKPAELPRRRLSLCDRFVRSLGGG